MPRRTYDPALQAALSRRLRSVSPRDWDQYRRNWTAFNALYNVEAAAAEEDRVMACIRKYMAPNTANAVLRDRDNHVRTLTDLPPGDTRRDPSDPYFRQRAQAHANVVVDLAQPPQERLAHLVALLYQVRCSLLHGNKDPNSIRDRALVTASNAILAAVLPDLESAFDAAG
jgi:hypothetical protein